MAVDEADGTPAAEDCKPNSFRTLLFGRMKAPAIASEIVVNTFHILGNFGSGYMFVVGEIGRPKQNRIYIHVDDDDRNDHCGVCERK